MLLKHNFYVLRKFVAVKLRKPPWKGVCTNPSLPGMEASFCLFASPVQGEVARRRRDEGVVKENNPSPASRELPLHKGALKNLYRHAPGEATHLPTREP